MENVTGVSVSPSSSRRRRSGSSVSEGESEAGGSADEQTQNRSKKARTDVPIDYDVSDLEEDDMLFQFQVQLLEKNFKGQKNFEKRGVIKVGQNSVEGVLRAVWDHCAQYIFKAVVFSESGSGQVRNAVASWCDDEPRYEDMDQFVFFHDVRGKRNITPSAVTTKMIHGWVAKTVTATFYRYSDSVSSAQKFHAVESQLLKPMEKDRAGAESIASLDQLKSSLKENHGHRLVSDDINWACWATYISTQPMTQRDELMQQLPPRHLINLFTTVPVHSDTVLRKTRLDLRIATNENRAYRNVVNQLKQDFANLQSLVNVIGTRIDMLESTLTTHEEMLNAMNSTLTVQENEYSTALAEQVTDCIDIDHA